MQVWIKSDFWKRITLSKSFLAHVAEALEMVFLCSGDSCEINCPAYPNLHVPSTVSTISCPAYQNLPDFSISLFHGLTNYHK